MSLQEKLEYTKHGTIEEVKFATQELLNPNQTYVLIKHLAAAINPSDLGMISGTYGELDTLPAIPGREGVGLAMDGKFKGKRVYLSGNTWANMSFRDEKELIEVEEILTNEEAATLQINPTTAYCLMKNIPQGTCIIQNAGNSAVGLAVIQLGRHLGIKTISIVRQEKYIEILKQYGADQVILDTEKNTQLIAEPEFGFNSIGGNSALTLIKSLKNGGKMITFGGMSAEKTRFPTRELIFNNIKLEGFWLQRYVKELPQNDRLKLLKEVENLVKNKIIQTPIYKSYSFKNYKEALQDASEYNKIGKIIFKINE